MWCQVSVDYMRELFLPFGRLGLMWMSMAVVGPAVVTDGMMGAHPAQSSHSASFSVGGYLELEVG